MHIGVLGTGTVGRTLASGFARLGHDVVLGTRNVDGTLAREGDPPMAEWLEAHGVLLQSLAETAAHAEVVVNATSGSGSLEALDGAGAENLASRLIVDVANPLDFSEGFPPTLSVANTDSLAERIQRRFPQAMVVKALNTVNAALMIDPSSLADGDHHAFICGNDDTAKQTVTELLSGFGWAHVVDVGDITAARGLEMYLALWVRLYGALGTPTFNVKLVTE